MRFDTSQQMKLGQQMRLGPRMIQSMEILQMPMMALQERIEQELESNIALEQVETPPEDAVADAVETADSETLDTRELVVSNDGESSADDWERLSVLESSYGDAFENEYSSSKYAAPRPDGERDGKMDAMANIAARGESLVEQLLHQWSLAEVDDATRRIGEIIISYIGDDGLLSADLSIILEQNARLDGLELDEATLETVLHEVQHWLEPPGVAARDPREALLLQIDAVQPEPGERAAWDDARVLIRDHYQDLLENRLPRIVQRSDLTLERIRAAIGVLRRLNLSPGRDLVDEDVPPILPDVVVDYDERNDEYVAALTNGLLPVLRIAPRYEKMARDRGLDKETREFVGNSVRTATWLIEAIHQRNNTLMRVVRVVLSRQREFFDEGPQALRPLPMIEVADQLGVHVATVSRAVADKWMQTPRGLFPLRRFFSGGLESSSGRDMSWDAVKAMLQEVVDAEDKTDPLSDEAIAQALEERGVKIARRTVVKYRQQLGIPPARRRKMHI